MAITTLDPKTALIVIDLQQGIVGLTGAHPMSGVVAVARIFPRIGETGSAQAIVDLLDTRSA